MEVPRNYTVATILEVLKSASEGLSFGQLKQAVHRSSPVISDALKQLQTDGLVERDFRTRRYRVTQAGDVTAGALELLGLIKKSEYLDDASTTFWKSYLLHSKTPDARAPTPKTILSSTFMPPFLTSWLRVMIQRAADEKIVRNPKLPTNKEIDALWQAFFPKEPLVMWVETFDSGTVRKWLKGRQGRDFLKWILSQKPAPFAWAERAPGEVTFKSKRQ